VTLAAPAGGSASVASPQYEIRIKGRLSASLLASFHGLTATVEPVETVLSGPVEDQAALYCVLHRVQALGLELMEVRRVVVDSPDGKPTRDA
jgi:hypothetical protein